MKEIKDNKHWKVFAVVIVVFIILAIPINRMFLHFGYPDELTSKEIVVKEIKNDLKGINNQNLTLDEVDMDYEDNLNIEIINNVDSELTTTEIESLCKEVLNKLGTNKELISKVGAPLGFPNLVKLRIYKPLEPYHNQHGTLIENGKLDLVNISFELNDFKEANWNKIDQMDLSEISENYKLYNVFIEKIKQFETNEPKLRSLDITYDNFINNIDGVFTESYRKGYLRELNEEFLLKIDDETLSIGDLIDISEEKLEEYRNIFEENNKKFRVKKLEKTIEITDAKFEGLFDGDKRAFSKTLLEVYRDDKEPDKSVLIKAYNFVEENGEWRINNIKENLIRLESFEELPEELAETLERYNNMEYVDMINIVIE